MIKPWMMASALCATSVEASTLETDVVLYNAFSPAPFHLTLNPQEALKGECLTHSKISPRGDAWRCLSGSRIFDPCYVRVYTQRQEVICPVAPWKTEGTRITLGRELPQPEVSIDMTQQMPWAMQLVNGKTCLQVNETGKPLYQCDTYGLVDATLHRCKGLWRVIMQSPNEIYTQTEPVAKAYY